MWYRTNKNPSFSDSNDPRLVVFSGVPETRIARGAAILIINTNVVAKSAEETPQIDVGVGKAIKTDDKKPEMGGNVADKIKDEVKEVIKPKALKQKTIPPTKEAKVKSDKLKEKKSKKEPSDSGESSESLSQPNKEKSTALNIA